MTGLEYCDIVHLYSFFKSSLVAILDSYKQHSEEIFVTMSLGYDQIQMLMISRELVLVARATLQSAMLPGVLA